MQQRHEEEFISTLCVIEGNENGEGREVIEGSKRTGSMFHAKMGRKEENQWKYLCFLSLKSLMGVVVSCDN